MEKPLDGMNLASEVGQRIIDKPELPRQGVSTDSEVYTEVVTGEMHLKRGTFGKFEVFSDEAARIGGTDISLSDDVYGDGGGILTAHPGCAVRAHDEVGGHPGELQIALSQIPGWLSAQGNRIQSLGER